MGIFRTIKKSLKKRRPVPGPSQSPSRRAEPLSAHFQENISKLRQTFSKSSDVVLHNFRIGERDSFEAAVIYTDGLVDNATIQHSVLEALQSETSWKKLQKDNPAPQEILDWAKKGAITAGPVNEVSDFDTLYTLVLSGHTIILFEGAAVALSVNTSGWEDRSVSEPASQTVVRGPREGFTENIRINTALIRRRIKDPRLLCEQQQIGRVTKTAIAVMYIKGIANEKVVREVHERLDRIDIDGILESGYIEELIQDETFTPFPTIYNTERPDVAAACLLEGRVAILVDGTPFLLVVPALFVQSFQSAEDYYHRADISTFLRMLRFTCFFIALLLPSLYIAITTFHQEMLPTPLLLSLAAQREGVPFPAFVEAIIMEVTFEILREAGVRMPRTVGQAVSIVGALVIGQAAVEAGIVSASMVIVVSLTAIANFVFPSVNMAISVRILRFFMMGLAASFGLYGITLGLLALLLHLNSLRSFGIPFMAPFGPFIADDQKDAVFRFPIWGMFSRPRLISQKNIKRENNAPPSKPKGN